MMLLIKLVEGPFFSASFLTLPQRLPPGLVNMERHFYICMLLLTISVLSFVCVGTVLAEKPKWVDLGKYAEYEVAVTKSTRPEIPEGKLGTIRWEIVDVRDDHAKIKFTINVWSQDPLFSNAPTSQTWYYDESIGFILGSEDLSALKQGRPPEDLTTDATVSSEVKTVQAGSFDCYKITIAWPSDLGTAGFFRLWYDKSSGILVALELEIRRGEDYVFESAQLLSTNAAKPIWNPIITWIIVGVALAVIVVVIVAIVVRKKTAFRAPPAPPPPTSTPPPPQM